MSAPRRRKAAPRSRRGRKATATRDFWGTQVDPAEHDEIRPSTDPSAMVRSLGAPPIAGFEDAARHYYTVVYEKAAAMAYALAATTDLLADDADDDD